MSDLSLLNQLKEMTESAGAKAQEYSGLLETIKGTIVEHFGENGLIAAYIATAAFLVFILSRLAKITFSTVKYLAIPAVALAFLGSLFIPYSFFALLPVTVTACSLVLLFKG